VLVKLLKNKLRVSCGVVRGVLRCTHSVAKAREFVKYLYVGTSNASKIEHLLYAELLHENEGWQVSH
jgi:hypothetical protein